MYKLIFILVTVFSLSASGQDAAQKPAIIYGDCHVDKLKQVPYDQWFTTGYETYIPNADITSQLKKITLKDISIQAYFGSWCGDSKRELPRFMKLMDAVSFPQSQLQIIGLGGSDSLYKQGPAQEEKGKGIFRVPTFIIMKQGKEIARINEYPVNSLEKDLLQILQGKDYTPNYRSFDRMKSWLQDGTFLDENISVSGLAGQLAGKTKSENELNSLGYLLLKQGMKKEALKVFQINYSLYPESANIASSLGEGYLENGDSKKAVSYLERALVLNKDPQAVQGILSVLYKSWKADSVK